MHFVSYERRYILYFIYQNTALCAVKKRRDKSALREEIHQREEEVFSTKRRVAYLKIKGESSDAMKKHA